MVGSDHDLDATRAGGGTDAARRYAEALRSGPDTVWPVNAGVGLRDITDGDKMRHRPFYEVLEEAAGASGRACVDVVFPRAARIEDVDADMARMLAEARTVAPSLRLVAVPARDVADALLTCDREALIECYADHLGDVRDAPALPDPCQLAGSSIPGLRLDGVQGQGDESDPSQWGDGEPLRNALSPSVVHYAYARADGGVSPRATSRSGRPAPTGLSVIKAAGPDSWDALADTTPDGSTSVVWSRDERTWTAMQNAHELAHALSQTYGRPASARASGALHAAYIEENVADVFALFWCAREFGSPRALADDMGDWRDVNATRHLDAIHATRPALDAAATRIDQHMQTGELARMDARTMLRETVTLVREHALDEAAFADFQAGLKVMEIGRASCRERVYTKV